MSSSFWGSFLTGLGESFANALIDGVSASKKTIRVVAGELKLTDENTMTANITADYIHIETGLPFEQDSLKCTINLIKYNLNDPFVAENIAFIDRGNWDSPLRQFYYLSKQEKKNYILRHPEIKKAWNSFKKMRLYNREQLNKLKEYNKNH